MGIDFDIRIEDLPENFQALAGLIGMDAVLLLSAQFGGERIHIYKIESLALAARDRNIVAEFKSGKDYLELARKYNLTSTRIRQVVAKSDAKRIDTDKQKQLSLF